MADFEAAKIVHENHLLLDQPLLRLPYELLRKNFRSAHWTVEKESTQVKTLLKDSATASLNGRSSPEDVLKSLDTMLAKMRGLKRKLSSYADEEARLYRQVGARVSHLSELSGMHTVDDVRYQEWSRQRLDRLLVDYLLRHGYSASAVAMADKKAMRDLVDIETFMSMNKIRKSLEDGSVAEALAWCNENKKELRKMDSNLEFMLRYQQYIELVRAQTTDKLVEAITHAKKYLIPYKDTYPREVHQAAGLLAFPPDRVARETSVSNGFLSVYVPYAALYSPDRWKELADLFVHTHNGLLALPASPLLHIALSSGLSALKTPACHGSHSAAKGSSVCPVCSTELNELARAVPYAHHSKSHVEHDLLLLPNGRVYGKAKLEDYAAKSGLPADNVKDLVTGDVYPQDKLKKVFIT
ncbi:hypothetical protein CONLIGDRAFT_200132 [Coniochaeta ligniaria NRRL 30616]|uniref:Negative regulation of gluconeogenesis n=1 Tax=Coniochaeta ligniaria NRRL 30616 TaxID=1408157 RepID=A0A1J7JWV8_9PEZI|nr:hypothetical protein CONLIGDRAFT_200132 [Coniochaeta ligniaria NRRL 30616]